MRSVEAVGETVDEAVERALRALRVTRGEVDVEEIADAAGTRVRVTVRADPVSPETTEPGETARSILAETLRMMGLASEVVARAGDEAGTIELDVSGADEAAVIGRHGQTLDALEHLLNRIAFRDAFGAGRIVIEVDGYRKRREQSLQELAQRLAERTRETGRAVALEPMSARDRRIVHLALSGDASVTTQSEGEGTLRRVVILPNTSSPTRS